MDHHGLTPTEVVNVVCVVGHSEHNNVGHNDTTDTATDLLHDRLVPKFCLGGETGYGVSVGCWHPDGATLDDLAAEVQRRAPEHAAEYEAAMALCRVRIAEWEAQR